MIGHDISLRGSVGLGFVCGLPSISMRQCSLLSRLLQMPVVEKSLSYSSGS